MKYANKIGAKYTVVLGDNEIAEGKANLKCMSTGEQTEVQIPDGLVDKIYDLTISSSLQNLTYAIDEQFKSVNP